MICIRFLSIVYCIRLRNNIHPMVLFGYCRHYYFCFFYLCLAVRFGFSLKSTDGQKNITSVEEFNDISRHLQSTSSSETWSIANGDYQSWFCIAISSDGQYLYTGVENGYVYMSLDGGVTWTISLSVIQAWYSVSTSSNGQYVYALGLSGYIYASNNYGSTWSMVNPNSRFWYSIACSSNGQYVYSVAFGGLGGFIYSSIDYGITWNTAQTFNTSLNWASIAVSGNGQYVYSVVEGGFIYSSQNYGVDWNVSYNSALPWLYIASSSSGQYIYAVAVGGSIYMSADFGNVWNISNNNMRKWYAIATSGSGQIVYAVVDGGSIYSSNDYGGSWNVSFNTEQRWLDITSSSNGEMVYAVVNGGYIYGLNLPPQSNNQYSNDDSTTAFGVGFILSESGLIALTISLLYFGVGVMALVVRQPLMADLNEVGSLYSVLFEHSIRSISLCYFLLFIQYQVLYNNDRIPSLILVLSKSVMVLCFLCFLFLLLAPSSIITDRITKGHLSHYLNTKAMKSRFSMRVFGFIVLMSLFDISLLRLLCWSKSTFTRKSFGYPNRFMFRLSAYGITISYTLQLVASIYYVLKTQNDFVGAIPFLIFSAVMSSKELIFNVFLMRVMSTMRKKRSIFQDVEIFIRPSEVTDCLDSNSTTGTDSDLTKVDRPSSLYINPIHSISRDPSIVVDNMSHISC